MPIISVFFGIIVRMHYLDHNPPHLHAEYQGFDAFFDIKTGRLLGGHFPKSAQAILRKWILKRKKDLFNNWDKARKHQPLVRIEGADES